MYEVNSTNNISTAAAMKAPLHPQALVLPILAFPSWILCIPPLFWHCRQGNIAAGSLILWCIMVNFFNSINPLIWPRDNLFDWWDGSVWCDINVRIQVGAVVGTTASATMIVRKLAKVMDTSRITISTDRNHRIKEKVLEIFWCWGYPLIMILLYYIIQPSRYMIFSIVGCISPFDASWPSIVLSYMWAPITTFIAGIYASILTYRLYRYRREFIRLVTARNTTKSRFIRLFIICLIVIAVYIPYTIWLLFTLWRAIVVSGTPYSWARLHDPALFNAIIRAPSYGQVTVDKWGQVVTGYIMFFIFGTGSDAENTYKSMLTAVGLGKCFPGLYTRRESGANTPKNFIGVGSWRSAWSSGTKSTWWRRKTMDSITSSTTRDGSVALGSMSRLSTVSTKDNDVTPAIRPSFFARFFKHEAHRRSILPLFAPRSVTEMTDTDTHKSTTREHSAGVSAHAWATDKSTSPRVSEVDAVHVLHEVRLDCQTRDGLAEEERQSVDAWA